MHIRNHGDRPLKVGWASKIIRKWTNCTWRCVLPFKLFDFSQNLFFCYFLSTFLNLFIHINVNLLYPARNEKTYGDLSFGFMHTYGCWWEKYRRLAHYDFFVVQVTELQKVEKALMSLPLTDVCLLERPSVKCKNKKMCLFVQLSVPLPPPLSTPPILTRFNVSFYLIDV